MMRRVHVLFPLCVFALSLSGSAQMTMQQAPMRDTRVAPTGPAEIHGALLTEGDDPQPVRRAEVRATTSGAPPQTTYTDAEGRFVLRNLPLGRYTVEATKPGYVRSAYGARRYDRPGTPVTITDADRSHTLQWRMARGAVITGRILDEYGQPAQGGRVNVQQVRVVNGERTLVPVPMVSSILGEIVDDRGEYRLFGLPAGDYVVSVMPRSIGTGDIRRMTDAEMAAARHAIQQAGQQGGQQPGQQPGASTPEPPPPTTLGFSQVYFPGVLSQGEAGVITVSTGDVRAGVDFNVRLVPTATLEGMVITPGGVAPASVRLSLTPKGGGVTSSVGPTGATMMVMETRIVSSGNQVRPDGTFSYGGVAPGAYTLNANVSRDGDTPLWAATDVTVDGQTVSGLSLVLQEGLTVSGTLAFEAEGVDPPVDLSRARINFLPTGGGGIMVMNTGTTTITENGFTARGLVPGPIRVIGAFSTPEVNWTLKSAVIKGHDVLDLPFVLEPGDTITDAVLTFTNRVQEVSGTLSDATNRPAPDYTIVVFPEDRALWSSARRVRTARPGTDGRYTLTGLPSGRYRIAAVTDIGPEETRDLALLEELAAASIVFSLGDGEKKVQDLRIAGM